jgi:glyoxylase-like metal-dependent hydrolase (beta-lactamase superfamily II)
VSAALLSQGFIWFGCTPPEGPRLATIERVRDNLYVVYGGGGNTGVLVTPGGVVLVDTKLSGWGPALLEQVRTITHQPITTIINTHTHGDHVGGNEFFNTVTDIVVQDNTARYMRAAEDVTAPGAPTRTFADRLSLTIGGDPIDLYYFGAGHTNGDAFIVFPRLHVAHAGDLFASKALPVIDAVHGGSGVAYPATLKSAADGIRDVDTIITGHDRTATWDDLREYADFNREFLEWTRTQYRAGKTVDEAGDAYRIPPRYRNYPSQPWVAKANVEVIYQELAPSTQTWRWSGGIH